MLNQYIKYIHTYMQSQFIPYMLLTITQQGSNVDMLPQSFDIFQCTKNRPTHLASSVSKWKYSLPYGSYFGGITAFTRHQYLCVNGFSNSYWGWGGEDDDMRNRVLLKFGSFNRLSNVAKTYHIPHELNESAPLCLQRQYLLRRHMSVYEIDGLLQSSFLCDISKISFELLKTNIIVTCD